MRNIKEVLRLTYHSGLSARQVAHGLNISRGTVKEYQRRADSRSTKTTRIGRRI
jgi:DNA-directed RNA polymerase specialized sigma24 family protein